MEFIWIGLFFVVLVASFLLAMRSMKNFQEMPLSKLEYGLFLIQNNSLLNTATLKKIHDLCLSLECIVSFEKLVKGSQMVTTIYAPKQLMESIPELSPLELEDYISLGENNEGSEVTPKKITKDNALPWVIAPRDSKQALHITESLFHKIVIDHLQHFFWQIVCQPLRSTDNFQVTIRAMVAENDPATRINLAKKIDQSINESTGFMKETRNQSSGVIFDSFAKRTITPKEVVKFELTDQEIITLLS